jgi:glycine cleavage system aminomethyltransferase T
LPELRRAGSCAVPADCGLAGTDISAGDTPYDAGLGFGVAPDKGDFNGREALADAGLQGRTRALRTLVVVLHDPEHLRVRG